MNPQVLRYALYLVLAIVLCNPEALAQRGKIIRPASTNILDPNADGFVSKTTAGFSTDGQYVDEFELGMFGIPKLEGDVAGDNIGNLCGITDLIPDQNGFSVYAVRDANDNIIFRFRVGDDNPSVEAWTILLDTDGNMGSSDPNATAGNPGFEIDITLIKRNNAGVLVYNIDGTENCPAPSLFYPIDSHFQISIADEVSCGDPDYFYDFYVPFSEVAALFSINLTTGMRYVAVTNVSATCAMGGNISDISGIDNNDPRYSGCETCAFEDLINNQCPTPIVDLCSTCPGFEKDKVSAPDIDEPIRAGQTTVSGATIESDIFIRLQVFTNTAPDGSPPTWGFTPREEIGVYSVGNVWNVNLAGPLLDFDKIVAIAQKDEFTVPCGANDDNSSSTSVTVVSPNTAPAAQDQTVELQEDAALALTLVGTDPEKDALTYTIVTSPSHGTLTGNAPDLTYTPDPDYAGSDNFTFGVNDGIFNSPAAGTVSIEVLPVNDRPEANNLSIATTEDTSVPSTLTASDTDGDVLTFSVTTPPAHGVLSGTAPSLTYMPNPNYFGQDTFTFIATDGNAESNTATVTITVTPASDDAPLAIDQNVSTLEDTPLSITLSASDPDFDGLTFQIVAMPSNGTLTGTAPDITYRPKADYFGSDSFTFTASDGTFNSNVATVNINVTPANDKPIALDQSLPFDMDTPKPFVLTGTDPDADALTFSVTTQPANGSLSGTPPNLTYTPDAGFTGADFIKFFVNDGMVDSDEASVSFHLSPASNEAPVATDQSLTTSEDVPVHITLLATDANGDNVNFAITVAPGNGLLDVSGGNVIYNPDNDFNGVETFKFRADDGSLSSNEATITITVTPVNDRPFAHSQSVVTNQNVSKAITLTASDVEGSPLFYQIEAGPSHGSITGTLPNITYIPASNFTGADQFTFLVNDGTLDSPPAAISILVNAVGSAPVATDAWITTDEDTPVDVNLTTLVSDADGDMLTQNIVRLPEHGTVSVDGAVMTYSPQADYSGADTVAFTVSDGNADSNAGRIFITVSRVNDPPQAFDQTLDIDEDILVDVNLSASDVDGDVLKFSILASPAHGTLTGTGATLKYRPYADFHGSDNFTFRANDGTISSNTGTVFINVASVNDAPVITSLPALASAKEDSVFRVCLNIVDVDGDPIIFSDPVNARGGGTMVREPAPFDFCYSFTPAPNYNGESVWDLLVADPKGLTGSARAQIVIRPVNDPPEAYNDYASINANLTLYFNTVENDVSIASPYKEFYDIFEADSTDLVSIEQITGGPFHGQATVADDGETIEYKASSFTFIGSDSVKYQVCDSGKPALCATAVLFIEVLDSDFPFKVYEGVSPNNDGLNDYMHIEGIHRHRKNLVRIFDRFNNMVWEGSDYDNEGVRWDGQSNRGIARSRLPDGTYYYSVYLAGNRETFSGYVILKEH